MLKFKAAIDTGDGKRLLERVPEVFGDAMRRALGRILPLFEARVK